MFQSFELNGTWSHGSRYKNHYICALLIHLIWGSDAVSIHRSSFAVLICEFDVPEHCLQVDGSELEICNTRGEEC